MFLLDCGLILSGAVPLREQRRENLLFVLYLPSAMPQWLALQCGSAFPLLDQEAILQWPLKRIHNLYPGLLTQTRARSALLYCSWAGVVASESFLGSHTLSRLLSQQTLAGV